jgi:ParB/RepB/Spo0J family partition protein
MSTDAATVERSVDAIEKEEIAAAQEKAGTVTKIIPLGLIEKSEISLRDVDRQREEYQLLVNSIRERGVLQPILVRELDSLGVTKYGLIDGLQRFTASTDAGRFEIPAFVVSMDDGELLEAQIITNATRVVTRPAEYSRHLLRILSRNPFMTVTQLAQKVCQSKTWVEQRLSLNKLQDGIQELVDAGKIHLTNAYALSKLPEEEQAEHVDAAQTEQPQTFVPRMKARVKEIRDAKKAGKDAAPAEFQPAMHLRKITVLKEEFEAVAEGSGAILALVTDGGLTSPSDIVSLALAWTLNFDEASQQAQREADIVRKQKKKDEVERKKKEREDAKQDAAAKDAANIVNM